MINRTEGRRLKRSDAIAEEIKRWIVKTDKKPGDKLPREHELVELFRASKGTVREALKVLEVHGLIEISTGPNGGATLKAVPYRQCLESVYSYLYFREVDTANVYTLRKLLEPELAASVAGRLSAGQVEELTALAHASHPQDTEGLDWETRRELELAFHDRLAQLAPDPLLALVCRLMNDILRSMVLPRYVRDANTNLEEAIADSHLALIRAIERGDARKARKIMADHIADVEDQVHAMHKPVRRHLTVEHQTDN
jgi:GntR family transcriptional repressor for pyruvate dehydrogenase complex